MPVSYSRLANSYRLGMGLTGFTHCLENWIKRLPIRIPLNAKILDVGCGTGILGISMKKSFPKSIVLATDLEEKFFTNIRKHIARYNFPSREFHVGIADINLPEHVFSLDTRTNLFLNPETFDVVIVGAALGYSDNPAQSILQLLKLVKTGGYFIDVEMSENITSRTLSRFFKYKKPGIVRIINILNENGCVIERIPFSLTELSAGLSRVGIIARKDSV